MKRIFSLMLACSLALFQYAGAQSIFDQMSDPYFGESCTSILVGKKASTDGSVITSHTCDGRYRTWATIEKGQVFAKDTVTAIYKGLLKTETPWDMRNVKMAGVIPQAKETFTFFNTGYPSMNEKQLAIGETTITGKRALVNDDGMFLIEELQRIALQRCSTARDAIKLIGNLIKDYGYGDWGECITIADTKEVWQMEIFGEGSDKIGGVWAAQRIPDDHVGISANIPRIGELNLKDKNHFMASDNVFDVAKKLGFWDGKSTFKFWQVYGAGKKPFAIRDFFVLNAVAPSLNLSYEADELPFSVKPDQKVSVHDVIALYRETYEGTEYDMTRGLKTINKTYNDKREVVSVDTVISPIAQPWLSTNSRNLYNYLNNEAVEFYRTVAVSWCSYSQIMQLRDWLPDAVGGVSWFSFDNPGQSPRVPIFSGTTELPESFNYCGQKRYRSDAAIWQYRKANRLATVAWQDTRQGMMEEVAHFESKVSTELVFLENEVKRLTQAGQNEAAQRLLTRYTRDFTGATMLRWKELEEEYWGKFGLGF
ncbi:MAG: C69 family dipeptidase [Tenuifilaceae bacterium]|nr:C69 family dipeptidase [Tenuifilaceae bacterium]